MFSSKPSVLQCGNVWDIFQQSLDCIVWSSVWFSITRQCGRGCIVWYGITIKCSVWFVITTDCIVLMWYHYTVWYSMLCIVVWCGITSVWYSMLCIVVWCIITCVWCVVSKYSTRSPRAPESLLHEVLSSQLITTIP